MSASTILSTTPSIDGKRITRYCGIVTGEAIMGANVFKDLFAGIRDIVGGRSATYEASCARRAPSPWTSYRKRRPNWAPMPSSASTSTTRPSADRAAC